MSLGTPWDLSNESTSEIRVGRHLADVGTTDLKKVHHTANENENEIRSTGFDFFEVFENKIELFEFKVQEIVRNSTEENSNNNRKNLSEKMTVAESLLEFK